MNLEEGINDYYVKSSIADTIVRKIGKDDGKFLVDSIEYKVENETLTAEKADLVACALSRTPKVAYNLLSLFLGTEGVVKLYGTLINAMSSETIDLSCEGIEEKISPLEIAAYFQMVYNGDGTDLVSLEAQKIVFDKELSSRSYLQEGALVPPVGEYVARIDNLETANLINVFDLPKGNGRIIVPANVDLPTEYQSSESNQELRYGGLFDFAVSHEDVEGEKSEVYRDWIRIKQLQPNGIFEVEGGSFDGIPSDYFEQ